MERNFGRYRTKDEDEIGRGGFGRVYRALDTSFNRKVALKVLTLEGTPEALRRFEDEANTTSKLQHKNIVTVLDYGKYSGMPYIVMELLDGQTLFEKIHQRCALTLLQKVEIMQQVAEGLQYAHARKVIHRDIKPANIMVLSDGGVKIMDFGIARFTQDTETRRTQAGDFLGTVAYTAPERFTGESDVKTDVFSFGVVYYEFLTGSNPFAAPNGAQSMYRINYVEVPPLTETIPDAPSALEHLIERLVAKDREERYDSFESVLRDARPILLKLQQERAQAMFEEVRPQLEEGTDASGELIGRLREILSFYEHAEARSWHDRLEQQSRRKVQLAKIERFKQESDDHFRAGRFLEASAALGSALKLDKDDAELRALLERAKVAQDTQTKVARLLKEARSLEAQDSLEKALEKLSELFECDAENRQAEKLRGELQNRIAGRRTAAVLQRAQDLSAAAKYDQALRALAEIDPSDPSAGKAIALRIAIQDERKQEELRENQRRVQDALAEARADLKAGRLEDANQKSESLNASYGDQTVVTDFRKEVLENVAAHRRAQAIARISQKAQELIDRGEFAEATSVVQDALRTYRSDTTLERLLKSALDLESAREHAAAIAEVLRECDELVQHGRLEDALRRVDERAQKLGPHPALAEKKSNLRANIEDRRRAEHREQEQVIVETALRVAEDLENQQAFRPALEHLESVGTRVHDVRLGETRQRLTEKLRRQERLEAIEERIQGLLGSEDWEGARSSIAAARQEFPAHSTWLNLEEIAQRGQRKRDFNTLHSSIKRALAQERFVEAEQQLTSAAKRFPNEVVWDELTVEVRNLRTYVSHLQTAEEALQCGQLQEVIDLIEPVLDNAPDQRAQRILDAAKLEFKKAEDRERHRSLAQIDAERKQRQAAISKGLAEASAMSKRQKFAEAIALLDRLALSYPDASEISIARNDTHERLLKFERAERHRAEQDEQKRRAQENARRKQADEIAAGTREASALVSQGDLAAAVALLKELGKKYEDDDGLKRFYENTVNQLRAAELAKREAEQQANRERAEREFQARAQAIDEGRTTAAELLAISSPQEAIRLLESLNARYPGSREIAQDLRAARKYRTPHENEKRKLRNRIALLSGGMIALILAVFFVGNRSVTSPEPKPVIASVPEGKSVPPISHSLPQDLKPTVQVPVLPSPSTPRIAVNPERLRFDFDGVLKPAPKYLDAQGDVDFTIKPDRSWLRVVKDGARYRVEVSTKSNGLNPGSNVGHILISSSAGNLSVPVQFEILRTFSSTVHWSGDLAPGAILTIYPGGVSGGKIDPPFPAGVITASVSARTALGPADFSQSLVRGKLAVTNRGTRNIESIYITVVSK